MEEKEYSPPLDPGIAEAVMLLNRHGVETFESCEGGPGHSYPEPTIRFAGERSEGFRALAVAMQYGMKVRALKRTYPLEDGEPTGPYWELTLWPSKAHNSLALSVQVTATTA